MTAILCHCVILLFHLPKEKKKIKKLFCAIKWPLVASGQTCPQKKKQYTNLDELKQLLNYTILLLTAVNKPKNAKGVFVLCVCGNHFDLLFIVNF